MTLQILMVMDISFLHILLLFYKEHLHAVIKII